VEPSTFASAGRLEAAKAPRVWRARKSRMSRVLGNGSDELKSPAKPYEWESGVEPHEEMRNPPQENLQE
jgi:hypothetical protein